MADTTLAAIQTKVRRLTRSPSTDQISDVDLNEYVNTFILYDFPEHLRLFTLHSTLKFYTTPNIDVYATNTIDSNNPLFDFKDKIITINDPVYIAGFKTWFSQSRDEFFNVYPFLNSIIEVGSGDGATTAFSGTLTSIPVLQNNVLFTSFDANFEGLVLRDIPTIDPVTGIPQITGDLVVPDTTVSVGTINYRTGVFSFTFPAAPDSTATVDAQIVPYTAARPQALLYYDNQFTVRPVPDKVYEVNLEAYIRPTDLLNDPTAEPELEQWWQYIAYGSAKKIFEDRMDTDSVAKIMPEFKEQERLVLRRTIVQQTNERVATIYTEQTSNNFYNGFGPGGSF